MDFHLDALLKFSWPEAKLYLHTFDFQKPDQLAGDEISYIVQLIHCIYSASGRQLTAVLGTCRSS